LVTNGVLSWQEIETVVCLIIEKEDVPQDMMAKIEDVVARHNDNRIYETVV
jgi:hypothetical protein